MQLRNANLATALLLCAAISCVPTAEDALPEAPASEQSALTVYPNSTFYLVTGPDLRRCVYPLCGGFYLKRVNQPTTVCSDGTAQPQCRILEFDYKALGLDATAQDQLRQLTEKGQTLLRGTIGKTLPIAGKTYDKFFAVEAWQARALATPSGTFSRVRQLPLACPACPSLQSEPLNQTTAPQRYPRLAFDPARFSTPLVAVLESVVARADAGLLVAGTPGRSGGLTQINVSQAYTPFPSMSLGLLGDACGSRRLPYSCEPATFCRYERAAICGRADAAGTCTAKPEICSALYMPVCGCDGKTYSSECNANAAGISADYDGPCP